METVLLQVAGGVAYITLNRPEKLNAFNREMALLLQEKLEECAASSDVRSIYLTGAGKGFSAGQDLAEVVDPNGPGMEKILSEQLNPIIKKIRTIEKPVVAAVNGVAAGAGANIALCCDIVVASSSSSFIQAFSKIGLIPDSGGTYFLPRLIGFQKASALMMLGEKISAGEAERLGMVYKVFTDDVFEEYSKKIAQSLAQMPTRGLWFTKNALNKTFNNSFKKQLQLEDQLQQEAAATDDFKEGVKAFLEKRTAEFKGS